MLTFLPAQHGRQLPSYVLATTTPGISTTPTAPPIQQPTLHTTTYNLIKLPIFIRSQNSVYPHHQSTKSILTSANYLPTITMSYTASGEVPFDGHTDVDQAPSQPAHPLSHTEDSSSPQLTRASDYIPIWRRRCQEYQAEQQQYLNCSDEAKQSGTHLSPQIGPRSNHENMQPSQSERSQGNIPAKNGENTSQQAQLPQVQQPLTASALRASQGEDYGRGRPNYRGRRHHMKPGGDSTPGREYPNNKPSVMNNLRGKFKAIVTHSRSNSRAPLERSLGYQLYLEAKKHGEQSSWKHYRQQLPKEWADWDERRLLEQYANSLGWPYTPEVSLQDDSFTDLFLATSSHHLARMVQGFFEACDTLTAPEDYSSVRTMHLLGTIIRFEMMRSMQFAIPTLSHICRTAKVNSYKVDAQQRQWWKAEASLGFAPGMGPVVAQLDFEKEKFKNTARRVRELLSSIGCGWVQGYPDNPYGLAAPPSDSFRSPFS
ncbi:hypothetical protein BU24DRAFT_88988 [Aaosphaeria arxii CBS 175.79]|uniref:Uncharacterized protein n=1 Tax=Aaosphaeria arxii CBS 175.79 TaxID=1450172 RepID=A0A6A5X7I1_9PLEO|nr:uncharacterized protein BU24DRAFT_88988 [Aaosphaeria arxii CBS 175.79]KAF2008975.1 hypothetical protein BU24DRAFT_88988 [Aaosphaeria arxii CBS 175.79]